MKASSKRRCSQCGGPVSWWRRNRGCLDFCSSRCEFIHRRIRFLVFAIIIFIGCLIVVLFNIITGSPDANVLITILIPAGLVIIYLSVASYLGNIWHKEGL